jgi:hypothetical protein
MSQDHLPYSQRADWADVMPLPPPEGKVVAIKYDQQHKETLGYFRACIAKVRVHPCLLTDVGALQGLVQAAWLVFYKAPCSGCNRRAAQCSCWWLTC